MSLSCFCSMTVLETAINKSIEAIFVYTLAAGNNSSDSKFSSPARDEKAITVSALSDYYSKSGAKAAFTCNNYISDDSRASFSNYETIIYVAAPCVCTLSSTPGNSYETKAETR